MAPLLAEVSQTEADIVGLLISVVTLTAIVTVGSWIAGREGRR